MLIPKVPSEFFPQKRALHPYELHRSRGVASSGFRPLRKIPFTAASRRSMGRISVPLWLIILSDQLPVIALVSRYLTNKLIGRRTLPNRKSFTLAGPSGITHTFGMLSLSSGQVPTCYAPVRRPTLAKPRSTCMY